MTILSAAWEAFQAYWQVSLVGLALAAGYLYWTRQTSAPSSAWARPADLKPMLQAHPDEGRMAFATLGKKMLVAPQEGWMCVLGGTRMNKTRSIVNPIVREAPGRAFVLSVKGDLFKATHAQRPGEVWLYDPTRSLSDPLPDGVTRAGYSPIDSIQDAILKGDYDAAVNEAQNTARAIAKESAIKSTEGGDFWAEAAAGILAAFMFAVALARVNGMNMDMEEVCHWAKTEQHEQALDLLRGHHSGGMLADTLQGHVKKDPKIAGSAFVTLQVALAAFDDPVVMESTRLEPRYRATWLLEQQQPGKPHPQRTVYVVGNAHEQERLAPLFLGIVRETTRVQITLGQTAIDQDRRGLPDALIHPRDQLYLVLDEAANIAPIPDLHTMASITAGLGIKGLIVFQDLAQARQRLGAEKAKSILANCSTRIMTGSMGDVDTLQYMAALLGEEDHTTTSRTSSNGDTSTTSSQQRRPVAINLRTLPKGQVLVIAANFKPVLAQLRDPDSGIPAEPRQNRHQRTHHSADPSGPVADRTDSEVVAA